MNEFPSPPGIRVVEVRDERDPLSEAALALIAAAFDRPERQPRSELRSEIAEQRLELALNRGFHLLVAVGDDGRVQGTVSGIYLDGVNAGYVTYLAVDPDCRGRRLAPLLRKELVKKFQEDAREAGSAELAWVVGEVQGDSPWLERLVRSHGALTFNLRYRHPGVTPDSEPDGHVLYREPIGDHRAELPPQLVRRLIYAIYRRGHRISHPLESGGFQAMLEELEEGGR